MNDIFLAGVARLGVRAVARDHGVVASVVYAQFWWDYALAAPRRDQAQVAAAFGLTVKAYRAQVDALVAGGWLAVSGRGPKWKVQLLIGEALGEAYFAAASSAESGTFALVSEDFSTAEIDPWESSKVEIDRCVRTPEQFALLRLNPSYASVALTPEFGTRFANSSYISNNTNNKNLSSLETKDFVCEISATPLASRTSKGRKQADGPLPTTSGGFRKMPMVRIAEDAYYATVVRLHERWNATLGVQYPLNPWRYAAWRTALVEQGYATTQLEDAMPRVAADAWAKANLADPHVMFTGNASKIERFFASNAATTHDRFGRTFPSTGTTFEF